ncbi:hypothetical protein EDD37DRAFT_615492 [Exophiala viscosa]|uniref:uncharacterized protein n=1 Tax=Exophiala viscosa TaxID=2486360 RepID=UPI0021946BC5|nr:hypothetical protein EDD37DRAFT_615492 [Exophiala viscosa]
MLKQNMTWTVVLSSRSPSHRHFLLFNVFFSAPITNGLLSSTPLSLLSLMARFSSAPHHEYHPRHRVSAHLLPSMLLQHVMSVSPLSNCACYNQRPSANEGKHQYSSTPCLHTLLCSSTDIGAAIMLCSLLSTHLSERICSQPLPSMRNALFQQNPSPSLCPQPRSQSQNIWPCT